MKIMEHWDWVDDDVEYIQTTENTDTREIILKDGCEALLIHKDDVIALAKEFNLVVYEKDSNL